MAAVGAEIAKWFAEINDTLERHAGIVHEVNGTIQFNIKDSKNWTVRLTPPKGEVAQGSAPSPDCTVEYSSAADFVSINNGKLNLKRAILTGRLKVHGNMKVLQKMHEVFDAARKRDAAAESKRKAAEMAAVARERAPSYTDNSNNNNSTTASGAAGDVSSNRLSVLSSPGSVSSLNRGLLPEWASDASAKLCTRCNSSFTFVRRKHHCRVCGRIFCQSCSSRYVGGQRSCDFCMQRLYGAPPVDGIRFADPGLTAPTAPHTHTHTHNTSHTTASKTTGSETGKTASSFALLGSAFSVKSPKEMPAPLRAAATAYTTANNNNSTNDAVSTPQRTTSVVLVEKQPSGEGEGAVMEGAAAVADAPRRISEPKNSQNTSQYAPQTPQQTPQQPQTVSSQAQLTEQAFGDEGEEGEVGVASEASSLQDRIRELEEKLTQLSSTVSQTNTLPEMREPDVHTIITRSEFASAVVQPLLFLLLSLGWKVVPLALLYVGITNLIFSSGSWILTVLGLGLGGWLLYFGANDSPSAQLFRRRMRVYGMSFVTFLDYRITRMLVAQAGLDEKDSDAVWESAHRRNAVRTFRIIRDLRGLWVKCGQYLSSRPDVIPGPYIKVLASLQDAMPARPLAEVRATIEEELGKPLDHFFTNIQEKALAAASIGQVHRGTLKDGTEVAIKVQHRGMDVIIGQDLDNLKIILSWLRYVETGFNLEGVMAEWLKEVSSELDFTNEAANMIEVRNNMMATELPVTVPRVIPNLFSKRVLVMRFIEGYKVNDIEKLHQLGISREILCDRVCKAYAHQIYRNGFFNGDPHPGNIMIVRRSILLASDPVDPDHERQRRIAAKARKLASVGSDSASLVSENTQQSEDDDEWIPVLLDFGLTKRLPDQLRLAFAKLVVSAEEMDYAGMLEAMDNMGMRFSHESAAEDLENLQYMFRDATPASEARAKHEEREKAKKEKAEKEATVKKADRKMTAWPTDIMFFLRASELLQGLCSHLETRHPFMKTMAYAARMAFVDRVPVSMRMQHPVSAPTIQFVSQMERRLHSRLAQLRHLDRYQGCQVFVFDHASGKTIANLAAGDLGPLDPRPVLRETLFPVLGLSRLGVIAAIQALVNNGRASYGARVETYWPAFRSAGKSACTVSELLRGRSGVEPVLPSDISTASFARSNWDTGAGFVAGAQPLVLPSLIMHRKARADGEKDIGEQKALTAISEAAPAVTAADIDDIAAAVATSTSMSAGRSFVDPQLPPSLAAYFYNGCPNVGPPAPQELISHLWFGWGWAVGSLVAGMAHGPAATPVIKLATKDEKDAKGAKAPQQAEAAVGGSALTKVVQQYINTPLALTGQFEFGLNADGNAAANPLGDRIAHICLGASGALDNVPTETTSDASDEVCEQSDQDEDMTMAAAMAAMELAESMTEAGLSELAALTAGGREHLMDPRMVNIDKMRNALVPSMNLYASAEALAKAMAFVVKTFKQGEVSEDLLSNFYPVKNVNYHGAALSVAHHTGMRLFNFDRSAIDGSGTVASGVGMCSLGGSTVLSDTSRGVTIAITTNRLTADRAFTKHILEIVCDELKMGTPLNH